MQKQDRRGFFIKILRTISALFAGGLFFGAYAKQVKSEPSPIRPPGALNESDFIKTCIKCGQCLEACPYSSIKLAKPFTGIAIGTPYLVVREIPCYMCEDIPCVKPCPSGALDKKMKEIGKAKMGLAVLIDHENCIAYQGLRCEVCYRACPFIGKAITIEFIPNKRTGRHALFIPVVHSNSCTGCGMCEHACILDEAAIKVLPIEIAKGKLGKHYRFGWKDES